MRAFGDTVPVIGCVALALLGTIVVYIGINELTFTSSAKDQLHGQVSASYLLACLLLPLAVLLKNEGLLSAAASIYAVSGLEWVRLQNFNDDSDDAALAGAIMFYIFMGLALILASAPLAELSSGPFSPLHLVTVPMAALSMIVLWSTTDSLSNEDTLDFSKSLFPLIFFSILAFMQKRAAYVILAPAVAGVTITAVAVEYVRENGEDQLEDGEKSALALGAVAAFISLVASWFQLRDTMKSFPPGNLIAVGAFLLLAFIGVIVAYDGNDATSSKSARAVFNAIISAGGLITIILLLVGVAVSAEGLIAAATSTMFFYATFDVFVIEQFRDAAGDDAERTEAGLIVIAIGLFFAFVLASAPIGDIATFPSKACWPHIATWVSCAIGYALLYAGDVQDLDQRALFAGLGIPLMFATLLGLMNLRLSYLLLVPFAAILVLDSTVEQVAFNDKINRGGSIFFTIAALISIAVSGFQFRSSNTVVQDYLAGLNLEGVAKVTAG